MTVSKTVDEGSSPYMRAFALVVQWIRMDDYGSFDKRSNRFGSTKWLVWSRRPVGLQNLQSWFDTNTNLDKALVLNGEFFKKTLKYFFI
jgi:hypothetical protein